MTMEALLQVKDLRLLRGARAVSTFREVSIATALVTDPRVSNTEPFTKVTSGKISKVLTSKEFFDFTISSVNGQVPTTHCKGSVHLDAASQKVMPSVTANDAGSEQWTMQAWYEKRGNKGLESGPAFQTVTFMRMDTHRTLHRAVSVAALIHSIAKSRSDCSSAFYAIHLVVTDACVQAAISGGTADRLNSLKAQLPVFLDQVTVIFPNEAQSRRNVYIRSRSRTTVSTSTVVNTNLTTHAGQTLIDVLCYCLPHSQYAGRRPAFRQ